MTSSEVNQKIQEAIKAIEEYEKYIKDGNKGAYHDEIKKGVEIIIEKRHVLNASGQACPRCGGSGTV